MKQYIDKSALVAEINKRIMDAPINYIGHQRVWAYNDVKDILNTLEVKEIDYKKAYEDSLGRAKELWGIYNSERHIIEFIFPEVCYLKDKENKVMKKLYNITDIFHLYYVDINNQNKEYKIKTFSKEWWKFIWKSRLRFRIRVESYYK